MREKSFDIGTDLRAGMRTGPLVADSLGAFGIVLETV